MAYKTKKQRVVEYIDAVLENVPQANRSQIHLQLLRQYGASPNQVEETLSIMAEAGALEYDDENIYRLRKGKRVTTED